MLLQRTDGWAAMLGDNTSVPMGDNGCLPVEAASILHKARSAEADSGVLDRATGLLVVLSMMRAESRCRLIRLTAPSEKVISRLVQLRPQADCWTVLEGMLLTPEVLLWLSVTLVKL